MANEDHPYQDVQDDAARLTKERLATSNVAVSNDLQIQPLVQAVTPNDAAAKKSNTGGVDVSGSPDSASSLTSDGFNDAKKAEDLKK